MNLLLGDVYETDISSVDLAFCYSSTWPTAWGSEYLGELSYGLGTQMKLGSRIITVDRQLSNDGPWEFKLLEEKEGENQETGGTSKGFVWEKTR